MCPDLRATLMLFDTWAVIASYRGMRPKVAPSFEPKYPMAWNIHMRVWSSRPWRLAGMRLDFASV